MVILDLLRHTYEKARQLYADVWLGFSEVDLHELLEDAGFEGIEVRVVDRDAKNPQFQIVLALSARWLCWLVSNCPCRDCICRRC